jgi:glycosyltransferase involved in cell wall biosynthesis
MSCGLPFVSANIPATREITQGGTGGFLYAPGDYQALAAHVIDLLCDKKLYTAKQDAVRALAKTYDWGEIAKETESVYKALSQ